MQTESGEQCLVCSRFGVGRGQQLVAEKNRIGSRKEAQCLGRLVQLQSSGT